jgi:proteasome lid subunit RPN8/RPN11
MTLSIPREILVEIHRHIEKAYPEEGAGLLLGLIDGENKQVKVVLPLPNIREESERHHRYMLSADGYLQAEAEAEHQGFVVLGVFHSHPDHPEQPSVYDQESAWPSFSYLITSVWAGQAFKSRSWILEADQQEFLEEKLQITD